MGQNKSSLSAETLAYEQTQKDETTQEFLLLLQATFGQAVALPPTLPFSASTLPWLMHEVILGKQALDARGEVRTTGFTVHPTNGEDFLAPSDASGDHEIYVKRLPQGIQVTVYLASDDQIEVDENDQPIDVTLPWA